MEKRICDKWSYCRGLALSLIVALFLYVGQACNGSQELATKEGPGTIAFTVQRLEAEVFTGASSAELAQLAVLDPQPLPTGHLVSTDHTGQALLQGQLPNNQTCQVYVFQLTSLVMKACPKSNYQGGNTVTCQEENTAVYKECKGNVQMTPSIEVEIVVGWQPVAPSPGVPVTPGGEAEGVTSRPPFTPSPAAQVTPGGEAEGATSRPLSTPSPVVQATPGSEAERATAWFSLTYQPDKQVTLVVVGEGAVEVSPVTNFEDRTLGAPIRVEAQQFYYTAPDAMLRTIAGLPPRQPLPLYQLAPLIEELGLQPWLERVIDRAQQDHVSLLLELEQVTPTATATPVQVAQVTPEPTFTASPTPCFPPAGWIPYTVKPGENLFRIALRYDMTAQALQQANCLPSAGKIWAGQILYVPYYIPPTPTRCFPRSDWVPYTVQPGDNLTRIAARYGLAVAVLRRGNCLDSNLLIVGQTLYVPYLIPTDTVTPEPEPLFVVHGSGGPLEEINVEEAIAGAVDWTTILTSTFPEQEPVASLEFPDFTRTTDQVVFDQKRSRQLLYDAGYREGFLVHLLVSQEDPELVGISEWIYRYLSALGLQVDWQRIPPTEEAQYLIKQYAAEDEAILWLTRE